jgi:hypothetical protein
MEHVMHRVVDKEASSRFDMNPDRGPANVLFLEHYILNCTKNHLIEILLFFLPNNLKEIQV